MCELCRGSRTSCYVRASKRRRRVCSLVGCYSLALSFIHFDIFFSLLPQCILLIDPFSVCPSPSNNDSENSSHYLNVVNMFRGHFQPENLRRSKVAMIRTS